MVYRRLPNFQVRGPAPFFNRTPDTTGTNTRYRSATVQPLTGKMFTHFKLKVLNEAVEIFLFFFFLKKKKKKGPVGRQELTFSQWTYLFFLTIFEVGSAICGAASSSTMLIIGRAIAGLGASGLTNGALTVLLAVCHPSVRPCKYHRGPRLRPHEVLLTGVL